MRSALREAIAAAARWYALLNGDAATADDRNAWRQWLAESSLHRDAWREVERVQAQFAGVPAGLATPSLEQVDVSRRRLMRRLGMCATAVPLAAMGWQLLPWCAWTADFRTAIGERRHIDLGEGAVLTLNTDTAVDVVFADQGRLVTLHRGEILLDTATDAGGAGRSLVIVTPEGRVRMLSARLTLRHEENCCRVAVLRNSAEVLADEGRPGAVLAQGEQVRFSRRRMGAVGAAGAGAGSWHGGSLVAVDMPLGELLDELARYRAGALQYDPSVAGLRISGAFPLDDTDKAIELLTEIFPLRQQRLSGYWVRIMPA